MDAVTASGTAEALSSSRRHRRSATAVAASTTPAFLQKPLKSDGLLSRR